MHFLQRLLGGTADFLEPAEVEGQVPGHSDPDFGDAEAGQESGELDPPRSESAGTPGRRVGPHGIITGDFVCSLPLNRGNEVAGRQFGKSLQ